MPLPIGLMGPLAGSVAGLGRPGGPLAKPTAGSILGRLNQLPGNPLFQMGMGLLAARQDGSINPAQAMTQGLLTAQEVQSQNAAAEREKQRIAAEQRRIQQEGRRLGLLEESADREAAEAERLERAGKAVMQGILADPKVPDGVKSTLGALAEADPKAATAAALEFYSLGNSANLPGSLQELDRVNADRAARGLPPIPAEEFLAGRRETSADMQAYNNYLTSVPQGASPLSFDAYVQNLRGGVSAAEQLGDVGMRRLDEAYTEASQAAGSLAAVERARGLIDEGIRTGTFAGARQTIARAMDTMLGRQTDEESLTSNTDAYVANAGQLVAQAITNFGAGTGLSDADREFARQMAGGNVNITEGALRRILDIQAKAMRGKIERYNRQYGRLKDRYRDVSDFYEEIPLGPAGGATPNDPLGLFSDAG